MHTDLRTQRPLGLVFYETNPYPRHAPRDTNRDLTNSQDTKRESTTNFTTDWLEIQQSGLGLPAAHTVPLGLLSRASETCECDYAESAITGREAEPLFGLGRVVGCRLIGQRLREKLVDRHRQADCLERPHQWAGQTSAGMLESTGASLSRAHAGSTLVGGRLRCDT